MRKISHIINKYIIVLIVAIVFFDLSRVYSRPLKTDADKINALILLNIIEDSGNLETNVTRAEFSKIIVKSSESKNKISDNISEAVCTDVDASTPYASYIKEVLDKGYMFTYLGGFFKPYDFVTYEDLSRACLALLSYTNEDFRGNQVILRNQKFKSMGLDENVKAKDSELVSKEDIINGIYNTLKEYSKDSNVIYGEKIFDKLIIDSDKELNASEYKASNVVGPFFARSEDELNIPFEVTKQNVYINLIKCDIDDLKSDIVNYGYIIYYLDLDLKNIMAYSERQDIASQVGLRKGYIYKIYYAASNMLVPYRVDIDKYKYMIDSEEAKFAFSASGSFKEDDYIIYLYNKMNEVNSAYLDDDGKVIYKDDESEPYNGSIITAFSSNEVK
ncbi:MAG: S-layer homology domain-containing protein [Lachnospiraceae bacterium]|nr:S-layer homology domain-containing protein [Lachnospiraceae bacterium]